MISFKQLYEGLISGEIKIDENGHDPFYGWGPKSMLESMKNKIEVFDTHSAFVEKGIVWSSHLINDHGRNTDEHISDIERDSPCSKCGEHFAFIYDHENKIIKCVVANLITESNGIKTDYKDWHYIYKKEECIEKQEEQILEIEITDTLVFSNFFRHQMDLEDKERDNKGYGYYSLNHTVGRKRIGEFYASINVGYQQTTNCSIEIYKKDNELLIILETYVYDEETGEHCAEEELPFLGYEKVGNISCDMWRYMFINEKDLNEVDLNIEDDDLVKVQMPLGKYKVYNYYFDNSFDKHKIGNFNICSRIILND